MSVASDQLTNDKESIMLSVERNGSALSFRSDGEKSGSKIYMEDKLFECFQQCLPVELNIDKNIVLETVKNPEVL